MAVSLAGTQFVIATQWKVAGTGRRDRLLSGWCYAPSGFEAPAFRLDHWVQLAVIGVARDPFIAAVAQWPEHPVVSRSVGGSSPLGGAHLIDETTVSFMGHHGIGHHTVNE